MIRTISTQLRRAGALTGLIMLFTPLVALGEDQVKQIDQFLSQHFQNNPIPGFSAVVVVGDEIVFQKGYGVVALGGEEPVTANSPIGIGSQTKSLTAMATMQLVEQGKLDLDAPVVKYLPWFKTADGRAGEITVRMLLHNTSGLKSLDRWLTSADRSEEAAEKSVRALSSISLIRRPGASFEYANENWTVLGLLIEQASGLSYSRYMQERVLDAMGMDNSTTALALFDEKQVLYGHYTGLEKGRPARPRFLAEALAAGSELRSSARDMGHYLMTLLNGGSYQGTRILSPESIDLLFEPGVTSTMFMPEMGAYGEEMGYAMGWVQSEAEGRVVHHHGGDAIVMTSWTMVDREAGIGASVLYNGPSLDAYRYLPRIWVVHNLLRIMQGKPISEFGLPTEEDPNKNDYELPSALLPRYVGNYMSANGFRATIELDQDKSRLIMTTGSLDLDYIYELDFASESTAILRNISGGTQTRFLMTPAGTVTGVEGGLFGGLYRKLSEEDLAGLQEVRSGDGSINLKLPDTWHYSHSGDAILARDSDNLSQLDIRFAPGSWRDRRAALLADLNATQAIAQTIERTETIGPFVWQELIWDQTTGSATSQTLLASTEIGDRRLEIKLTTPPGALTNSLRQVLLPLFTHLQVTLPN